MKKPYLFFISALSVATGGAVASGCFMYSLFNDANARLDSARADVASSLETNAGVKSLRAELLAEAGPYDKFLSAWDPVFKATTNVSDVQRQIEHIAETNKCKILKPVVGAVDAFRSRGKGARATVPSGIELEFKISGPTPQLHNALADLESVLPHAQVGFMSYTGPSVGVAERDCTLVWNASLPVYPPAPDAPAGDPELDKPYSLTLATK